MTNPFDQLNQSRRDNLPITKREHIAATILSGILASGDAVQVPWIELPEKAVKMADKLLEELQKP